MENLQQSEAEIISTIINKYRITFNVVYTNDFEDTLQENILVVSNGFVVTVILQIIESPEIPIEFSFFKHLSTFIIRNASISRIPDEFFSLSITHFEIDYGNLTGSIPKLIKNWSGLQVLNLHGNQLDFLPDELFECSELEFLSLWGNVISHIPEKISKLKKLKYFHIGLNSLQDLPISIGSLHELHNFTSNRNYLTYLPK